MNFNGLAVLLSFVVGLYLYVAFAVSWSDMDYCKRGISPEMTCRDTYTIWNWI